MAPATALVTPSSSEVTVPESKVPVTAALTGQAAAERAEAAESTEPTQAGDPRNGRQAQ